MHEFGLVRLFAKFKTSTMFPSGIFWCGSSCSCSSCSCSCYCDRGKTKSTPSPRLKSGLWDWSLTISSHRMLELTYLYKPTYCSNFPNFNRNDKPMSSKKYILQDFLFFRCEDKQFKYFLLHIDKYQQLVRDFSCHSRVLIKQAHLRLCKIRPGTLF